MLFINKSEMQTSFLCVLNCKYLNVFLPSSTKIQQRVAIIIINILGLTLLNDKHK